MERITEQSSFFEDDIYHLSNMNEISQSSPMLSYKVDKYHRFFHPINSESLLKLIIPSKPSKEPITDTTLSPLKFKQNLSETELLKNEFKKFNIKDGILSPSPKTKRKLLPKTEERKKPKKMKISRSFCLGLFSHSSSKELKKWWINSVHLSVIGTTYHNNFKYFELNEDSLYSQCITNFKKFPRCEDISINIETMAELSQESTVLIRNLITLKKMHRVIDIRFISFPGEKTLWHGPAFLFNSVMGFNKNEEYVEGSNRLEIWHRFRSYYDRGAFQYELIDVLVTLNIRLYEEKVQILHLILASHYRIRDEIIPHINDTLKCFLKNLIEFKLLLSSRQLTNIGLKNLCSCIDSISPKNLRSFHIFLDYRSKNITEIGIMSLCKTLLAMAENNIIEYLSLGFLSQSLSDQELSIIGEALRMLSKNLRSLVLILVGGGMTDEGVLKLLDGVLDGLYLRKVSLGLMGSNLKGNSALGFLADKMEKKSKNGSLNVFHLYFNNNKGRNEEAEKDIKKRIGSVEVDIETYIFC